MQCVHLSGKCHHCCAQTFVALCYWFVSQFSLLAHLWTLIGEWVVICGFVSHYQNIIIIVCTRIRPFRAMPSNGWRFRRWYGSKTLRKAFLFVIIIEKIWLYSRKRKHVKYKSSEIISAYNCQPKKFPKLDNTFWLINIILLSLTFFKWLNLIYKTKSLNFMCILIY